MGRTTLEKWKESLLNEASDINKLIERRRATTENTKRLEEIEIKLGIIESMKKPNKKRRETNENEL